MGEILAERIARDQRHIDVKFIEETRIAVVNARAGARHLVEDAIGYRFIVQGKTVKKIAHAAEYADRRCQVIFQRRIGGERHAVTRVERQLRRDLPSHPAVGEAESNRQLLLAMLEGEAWQ